MLTHGQAIYGPDGMVSVENCATRQIAIEQSVYLAISSGWRPPRWWDFWALKWSKECRAEYQKQMNPSPPNEQS